jgi:hypothetical protein
VPFTGATVAVITAMGESPATTTDSSGAYTLQVSPGAFLLRYSARGYLTRESKETAVAVGDQPMMPIILLKTGPWALAGTATDSRGVPVSGVRIAVSTNGLALSSSVTSDNGGHYRYVAPVSLINGPAVGEAHWETVTVSVSGAGVWAAIQQTQCCNSPDDTIYDIKVRHVLGLTVHAPSTTLHVGDTTKFTMEITFDDSDLTVITTCPTDNQGVLAQEIDSLGFQTMRAIAPGIATATCGYLSLPTTIQIQVLP